MAPILRYCSREYISAAFFACAILLALNSPPVISMRMGLYLCCLVAGYYFAPKYTYWSKEVALCLVIGASALIAIPASILIEGRNAPATAFLASLTLMLFPLIFVTNTSQIFYALIPGWYLQAGVMVWQWFAEGVIRAGGIAENSNAGSSFLLLGAIFLMTNEKLKWLSVPLLVVIPFSGSRWVTVVGVIIFGLMFLGKHIRWQWVLAAMVIAFAALFVLQHDQLTRAYRVQSDPHIRIQNDVHNRANAREGEFSVWAIWIPRGFHDTKLHSLPMRMADETGMISALAWMTAGIIILYRRPRLALQWWCMIAVCLLSVMYYFTWIGPLGMFWWMLLAKEKAPPASGPSLPEPRAHL